MQATFAAHIVFFRPFGGLVIFNFLFPRLAPWAAFFRRFAAGALPPLHSDNFGLRSERRIPPVSLRSLEAVPASETRLAPLPGLHGWIHFADEGVRAFTRSAFE